MSRKFDGFWFSVFEQLVGGAFLRQRQTLSAEPAMVESPQNHLHTVALNCFGGFPSSEFFLGKVSKRFVLFGVSQL
eukprot:5694390-Amphidinium_carterae.1